MRGEVSIITTIIIITAFFIVSVITLNVVLNPTENFGKNALDTIKNIFEKIKGIGAGMGGKKVENNCNLLKGEKRKECEDAIVEVQDFVNKFDNTYQEVLKNTGEVKTSSQENVKVEYIELKSDNALEMEVPFPKIELPEPVSFEFDFSKLRDYMDLYLTYSNNRLKVEVVAKIGNDRISVFKEEVLLPSSISVNAGFDVKGVKVRADVNLPITLTFEGFPVTQGTYRYSLSPRIMGINDKNPKALLKIYGSLTELRIDKVEVKDSDARLDILIKAEKVK